MNKIKILSFTFLTLLLSCTEDNEKIIETVETTVSISDFTVTIDENPLDNKSLGTINATTNQGELFFSIIEQSLNNALKIDSLTGEIFVLNSTVFDFETNPIITGIAKVENGVIFDTANITINLNNINEPQNNITIDNITPLKAKIGDVITINGSNLESIEFILFNHNNSMYNDYNNSVIEFISQNNEEIKMKVPELVHEDIIIVIPEFTDVFELDLVGYIPVVNDFDDIRQIQVLNENIAFLTDNYKIYKSTDGFYNWEVLYESPSGQNISSFYFLDENTSWIGLQGDAYGISMHYSENGGSDYNLKFQVNNSPSGNQIKNIKFTSLTKGFFVDNNQEMYVTDNTTFENIYDYYPNLSSLPFGEIEIYDFNAINDDLIFLSPNDTPTLIKIDNQDITHYDFNTWPLPPLFFDNIGYVQVNSNIYKSSDLGDSWSLIKTFDNHYPQIKFLNNQEGFAFVNYDPEEIHITSDGGASWEIYFTFPEYHGAHFKDFTATNGLIGSFNGRLWKFRKE